MEEKTNESTINRGIKDSLFRMLFSDSERALSLYNALNGTYYSDKSLLEFRTLEDAIYMTYKNDNSFIVNGDLNLYEHQSSFNPNMPLRGFLYFSRTYEGLITNKKMLYSGKLIKIPTPRYVVFYNGTEKGHQEDVFKLKLSEAFINPDESGEFEWTATVININAGHNEEIVNKCIALKDYSIFIGKIRKNVRLGYEKTVAIQKAIDDCIEENVLQDFLMKAKSEVSNMILTEFDEEGFKEMIREEGREEGRMHMLEQLVRDNAIDVKTAAQYMGISEDAFLEHMATK